MSSLAIIVIIVLLAAFITNMSHEVRTPLNAVVGFRKRDRKKIFSRFIKLDREMQGTGLRLTLSQTIIRNPGGNLELDSEINWGSTFSFVLPQVMKPEQIKPQVIK